MNFRSTQMKDFDDLLYIEEQAHIYPWPESTLLWCLEQHHIHCSVLQQQRETVGFTIYECVHDEASLLNIAILPTHQGKGLGRHALIASLLALPAVVQTVFLEVRINNAPAIALYETEGFIQTGMRKNYYPHISGREHALTYQLPLHTFRSRHSATSFQLAPNQRTGQF